MDTEELLRAFRSWAERAEPGLALDMVERMLRLKPEHGLTPSPRCWIAGEFEELLRPGGPLRAGPDDPRGDTVISAATALVDFLEETGQLDPRSADPGVLRAELANLDPQFVEAVRAMWEDSMPDDYRDSYPEPADLLPYADLAFPPRRAIDADELAEAAAKTVMIERLEKLAAWVGDGRPVTELGVLRPADVAEACAVLDLPRPPAKLRSARHHLPLHAVWVTAQLHGWLDIHGSTAVAGARRWRDEPPRTRLTMWADALCSVSSPACAEIRHRSGDRHQDLAQSAILSILPELYLTGGVDPTLVLAEVVLDSGLPAGVMAHLRPPVARWLDLLVDLGAVVPTEQGYGLTPLGSFGINRLLQDLGAAAAWVDLTTLTAAEVITDPALQSLDDDFDVAAEWAAGRDPNDAADALLLAAAEADTAVARIGLRYSLETHLAGRADETVDQFINHPRIGPHLRALALGPDDVISVEDDVSLLTDVLAATFSDIKPPHRFEDIPPEFWIPAEPFLFLSDHWPRDHPELLLVLDAIALGHPDPHLRDRAESLRDRRQA